MTLLLIGLLLAVFALPVTEREKQMSAGLFSMGSAGPLKDNTLFSLEEEKGEPYERTNLEKRLEQVLSAVRGVGEVKALLMTSESKANAFGTAVQQVSGVLIVAEGADNPVTVQNIKEAVMALFPVEAHKIKIMKMK